MTANFKRGSEKASRNSSTENAAAANGVRKPDQRIDSPLLSPLALMALGLTGAAAASVSREPVERAQNPGVETVAAENSTPSVAVVEAAAAAPSGELGQQLDALLKEMMTEESALALAGAGTGDETASADADAAGAAQSASTDAAGDAAVVADATANEAAAEAATTEPIQLAMADNTTDTGVVVSDVMSPIILAQAATGTAATGAAGGAGTAAAGTAAAAISTQAILATIGVLAVGAAVASNNSGDNTPAVPAAPPAAPTLALGTGVSDGANATEATQAGGVITVNGVSGASIVVTLTNGAATVTKTVTGTGAAQAVTLDAGDLTTLGDGTISVSAVATAAGQTSTATTTSFALDGTAPAAPTVTLSATQAVLTDSAFDVALGANKALGDVVQLQVGGVNVGTAATVDAAALAAGTVSISIAKTALAAGANSVTAAVTDAVGNAGTASAALTINYSSGAVSDGYIDGATVWADMDNNGQVSTGDIQLGVTTKGVWNGVLDASLAGKHLITSGGTDISTGLAFKGTMSAPAGSTSLNPLTTLLDSIIQKTGDTTAAAQTKLAAALGLPTGVDLTTFDLVGATLAANGTVNANITQAQAIEMQSKALMVANMITAGVAALDGAHTGADDLAKLSQNVALELGNYIANAGGTVDLTNSTTLAAILTAVDNADTTISLPAATITAAAASLASTNQIIGVTSTNAAKAAGTAASATDTSVLEALTQILQAQSAFQGTVAGLLATEGTADMSVALANYDSAAKMLTAAGTVSTSGLTLSDTVTSLPPAPAADTTAPTVSGIAASTASAPLKAGSVITLSLNPSEGVFINGTPALDITVGSTARTATYDAAKSSNGLLVFTYTVQAGDDGAVTVTGVSSGANVIEDLYGNDLSLSGFAAIATGLTADTTAPAAPALALASDTGSSAVDMITTTGQLAVTGNETGAAIEYSANGTSGWAATAPAATEGSNTVYVRQTDTAGNVSAASAAFTFALDTTAPTASAFTPADGGSSVTLGGNLLIATSEAVEKGTGSISIYKADATLVETLDVSSSRVTITHAAGHGIAIDPTALLVKDQGYYVQMSAGAFTDAAGNALAGISDATTWNFTGAGPGVVVAIGAVAGDNIVTAAEAAAAITVSGTLAADAAVMAAYTAGNMTATVQTGSAAAVNLTGLAYDSTTGNWSGTIPAGTVSGTAVYTVAVAFSGTTGTAAEGVVGDSSATIQVDTPAKLTITDGGPAANGDYTYTFTFDQNVAGFVAGDVTVTNGTAGTFAAASGSSYTLQVAPTASATPLSLAVSVAADAATGDYANGNVTASGTAHSVLYGDATANTVTLGASADTVFLGAGNDIIKFAAASGSTAAATDKVLDFTSGDKVDLATVLGTGGAGYTGSTFADTGAGFVEIKNVALTKGATATQVTFDINFDAASIAGSKIAGAVVDLQYDYTLTAATSSVTNPTFSVSDEFGGFTTSSVWSGLQANLAGTTANGKIALTADFSADNPIIDANGKAFSVKLIINSVVDTFQVGIESKAVGGTTEILTADNVNHAVDVGVTKVAGATVGATGTLEVVADTGTLGTVGDNQLHLVSAYDAATNTTHLQVQYDTNPTFGSTTVGDLIALDFMGDVTANLTPTSLTYI